MFVTKMSLPRRTFLQRMGVTMALPLLEAMVPAATALARTAASGVRRVGFIYIPHGKIMDQWTPDTTGTGFAYKRINKPLEPLGQSLVLVSGMDGAPNRDLGGHATGPASFLSGVAPKRTEAHEIFAGRSVDQMIANEIGRDTAFASLEVATEAFTGFAGECEVGYGSAVLNTISWATPTRPLPVEINPRALFDRMFCGGGMLAPTERSVLDAILPQAKRLQIGLGANDRVRLDEHFDSIREVERRIQMTEATQAASLDASAAIGIPENFGEHCRQIFDLLTIAYQADLTRVFSFMMARDLHARTYEEIGADESHHALSHHGGDETKIEKFAAVNTYHVSLLASFLEKLQSAPDGDGSLLDHSLIVYGSGMSNGDVHSHVGLPFVVAGGGIRGGRHIAAPKEAPHGNLLVAVARKVGLEIEKIGLSTGSIDI